MSDAERFLADARKSFRVAAQRQQKRRVLEELKRSAIIALEHRGYAVRGKTTSQIREVLRRRPTIPLSQRPE